MTKAVIWTKTVCPYCVNAKNLLKTKGIDYEERNIQEGTWTREQLLEAVPGARTVPQVFINDKLIGTYDQLKQYFSKDI